MNELELMRRINRELFHKRTEIDRMKSGERKIEAMKLYAEFLTTIEVGTPS